jgi:uncharacterized membrane protein YdbT with pleckstrin-like domain
MLIFVGSAALGRLQPVPFAKWAPGAEALREPALVLALAVMLVLIIAYPVRRVLRWAGTRYVLTNKRLLVRGWIFGKIKETHVLEQVQEVRAVQNWRQRMVGSGDLHLHMYKGAMRKVPEVPVLRQFNEEIQQAWTREFRASIQQTPQQGS